VTSQAQAAHQAPVCIYRAFIHARGRLYHRDPAVPASLTCTPSDNRKNSDNGKQHAPVVHGRPADAATDDAESSCVVLRDSTGPERVSYAEVGYERIVPD